MPADAPLARIDSLSPALRELLGGVIDYAGLFPPAQLDMRTAVENYTSYLAGPDAWALGRFVVPAARLEEFGAAVERAGDGGQERRGRLSALIGADWRQDLERIHSTNEAAAAAPRQHPAVDTVEFRADSARGLSVSLDEIPTSLTAYVEIPIDRDPTDLVVALRKAGGRAKVRTGGVSPEMFPQPDALLGFLRACVEVDLPFKATAGLHHPVVGHYRLTYETDSPPARMYGYLNLLFATALLRRGAPEQHVAAALAENDAAAFRHGTDEVSWREYSFGKGEIIALRERGMVAFGSCSFLEPLDELRSEARRETDDTPSHSAPQ